ncbi:MAG TPA: hypothetical protein VLM78_10525, partial [Anaerolineales bacterium]|nr:hypothetical protein [Anaerolineales bacterium]
KIVCAGLEGKNETYLRFFGQYLEGFPVARAEKSQHDKMVSLVSQMLELHKSKAGAKTQSDQDVYKRQICAVDEQIDSLVYALYGLSEEETRIVGNKFRIYLTTKVTLNKIVGIPQGGDTFRHRGSPLADKVAVPALSASKVPCAPWITATPILSAITF